MMPIQPTFQKFKDGPVKKPLKRLIRNSSHKGNRNSYSQKLANSIKRRAFSSLPKNATNVNRKLNFQQWKMQRLQQQHQLPPKPQFYRNDQHQQQQPSGSRTLVNEGEIIEEIMSSDEDDCIVLEPDITKISLDDDPVDEPLMEPNNADIDDDIPSCSRFQVDTKPEIRLWERFSNTISRTTNDISMPNNDSCIIINDSFEHSYRDSSPVKIIDDRRDVAFVNMTNPQLHQEQSDMILDDSVVFVEEGFIPLPKDNDNSPRRKRKLNCYADQKEVELVKTPKLVKQSMDTSFFTKTERKKLEDYNSNTYNPDVETNAPITHKRPIIIDGSNVAFGHGRSNIFSAEGIKYCVEFFHKMGHDVKAVIPLFRRNPFKSSNPALLDQLHKDGKIVFTPCKNLPNQQSISYDDRFILQLAYERNAAIVSNDNYRDLINENAAFKKIIENRVIGYSWCDNILILPKDPYGRFGPPLAEILRC